MKQFRQIKCFREYQLTSEESRSRQSGSYSFHDPVYFIHRVSPYCPETLAIQTKLIGNSYILFTILLYLLCKMFQFYCASVNFGINYANS